MQITVRVTSSELEVMGLDDVGELEGHLRHQLDNGVAADDGEAGQDWLVPYELQVNLVD